MSAHLAAATRALKTLEGTKAQPGAFARELERRFGKNPAGLAEVNVPDLALAWAALAGDAAAVRELDRRLRACSAKLDDDVVQLARQRLLVGANAKLGTYGGRGALVKWLRTVLLSISVDARRRERPEATVGDEQLVVTASSEAGADVRLMKAHHRAEFTRAFSATLATLEPRERTVLRMKFVDQLSLEDIGRSLGTHRTTAMRWMEAAFQKVLRGTRARLAERLSLESSDLDDLWRVLEPSLADRLSKLLPP